MTRPDTAAHVWPDAADEILLRAALTVGPAAREAWTQFQELRGVGDRMPQGWHQLWPLVYHNLRKEGTPRDELASLRECSRAVMISNRRLLADLDEALAHLHDGGVDTLVFKGVALAALFYRDWSARTIGDSDVLVPAQHFERAAALLMAAGRKALGSLELVTQGLQPGLNFVRSHDGRPDVDLHVHLFHADCGSASELDHWNASIPLRIGQTATRTLCASDHLTHVCTHGLIFHAHRDLRWVADAVTILRDPGTSIDWERVVRVAQHRQLTGQMALALDYLRRTFAPSIPAAPLRRLEQSQPDWSSRTLANALMRANPGQGYRWWTFRLARLVKAAGGAHPAAIGRLAWASLNRKYRAKRT